MTEQLDFDTAAVSCAMMGSSMVKVEDLGENQFIQSKYYCIVVQTDPNPIFVLKTTNKTNIILQAWTHEDMKHKMGRTRTGSHTLRNNLDMGSRCRVTSYCPYLFSVRGILIAVDYHTHSNLTTNTN